MFPQRHSIISGSGLEQMLQLPSVPMPLPTSMDRSSSSRWKPNIEVAPNCPRCSSTNTKFCYYNNYSLSQPRYFCKGCRRYWTKGGSLRNVPVGGGCRKNRRGKSTRQQQNERLSMNNGNSGGCDDRESSSVGDGDRPGDTNNGSSDIDMALVFAKFLNQNPSSGEEFESEANNGSPFSNNLSTSLTRESFEAENDAVMQPQEPSDSIDADALLMGGVPLEETIENFLGEEMSLSGIDELEGFLGMGADDDVVQNVLWSDATMSSSVTSSQPPMMQMQLQELEYSMMPLNDDDGQLLPIGSTMNLISDSWSTWSNSFDLSMLEVFSSSRP